MAGEDILLHTHNQEYITPPETNPSTSTNETHTTPYNISRHTIDAIQNMVKGPLRQAGHNSKDAHNYNTVDDLAQIPSAMSTLKFCNNSQTNGNPYFPH